MKKNLKNKGIVLFDGYCNLCSWSVQFIIKRDKNDYFRFASIQSEVGKNVVTRYNINLQQVDSVVFIENNTVYLKSNAVFKIVRKLNTYLKYSYNLIYIPKVIRDFFYDIIAKNRFRFFGRKKNCYIPNQDLSYKFL